MRVLIIEDEQDLQEQIRRQLQDAGYAVDAASDGREGLYMGKEYPFDIAVVDLGLPQLSGIEVIRQWRNDGVGFPVIILTARGRWQDKVEGLDAGADDYVVKPFHPEELQARVKALLRRAAGASQPNIKCGPVQINTSTQRILVDETELDLTAYEYRVIEYLVMNPGKVISKTELTEHIYDQDFDRDSNVIEVFIGRLRKKLDPTGELKPIETLRGRGYRFTLECTD